MAASLCPEATACCIHQYCYCVLHSSVHLLLTAFIRYCSATAACCIHQYIYCNCIHQYVYCYCYISTTSVQQVPEARCRESSPGNTRHPGHSIGLCALAPRHKLSRNIMPVLRRFRCDRYHTVSRRLSVDSSESRTSKDERGGTLREAAARCDLCCCTSTPLRVCSVRPLDPACISTGGLLAAFSSKSAAGCGGQYTLLR